MKTLERMSRENLSTLMFALQDAEEKGRRAQREGA
jgi:hypothetical protein